MKNPFLILLLSSLAFAETEEQRLVRISKHLKPISDQKWSELIGVSKSDVYEIQKGDNLWNISKRLFGNPTYWPKVWSINAGITNPHIVSPGQKLTFIPGSSEQLPRLDTGEDSPFPDGNKVLHEYDKVPEDKWAPKQATRDVLAKYDDYGIDKDLRLQIPSRFVFRVPSIANDSKLPFLGEVVSSRRDGVGLAQHETVFIKSNNQDLQVGSTYTVFTEPENVHERKSDRTAYVYNALAEIKIIGVKDELYIGVIEKSFDVIRRGDKLYAQPPLITDIKPVPANSALEALVLFGGKNSTKNSAQFHFVHMDRGIEDGVQVGNVFRLYEYYDPTTKDKITDSDFLIHADAIVVHVTAQFSTALVIRSRDTFTSGDFGVLLTDVSDLEKKIKDLSHELGETPQQQGEPSQEDKELDELDRLDENVGEGMGKQEEAEVKELEQWDRTKDMQNNPNAEPTLDYDPNAPSDQVEQFPGDKASPSDNGNEPQPWLNDQSGQQQPPQQENTPPSQEPAQNNNSDFQATPGVEPLQNTPQDNVELQNNR